MCSSLKSWIYETVQKRQKKIDRKSLQIRKKHEEKDRKKKNKINGSRKTKEKKQENKKNTKKRNFHTFCFWVVKFFQFLELNW